MKESCKYVLEFLRSLNSMFNVEYSYSASQSWIHKFTVEFKNEILVIEHSSEIIDDFDVALLQDSKDNYFYALESKLNFNSLIPIGVKGWITNYSVAEEFINEKRNWSSEYSYCTRFNNSFSKSLYEGLLKLKNFLQGFTQNSDLELDSLKNDQISIDNLIDHYESAGNLNSRGAEVESLSFLKAAALTEIISLEKQKKSVKLERVKAEYDKSIYKIVKELRNTPFIDIELPECLFEFNSSQDDDTTANTQILKIKPDDEQLDSLLDGLDIRLKKRREGAWLAFKSNNPDRLSQSSNSMVELLDDVIGLVIGTSTLESYLKNKFGYTEEVKWIEATRKWISETKSNLHRVKHHIDYKDEVIAEKLLSSAEMIMILLLS